MMSILDRINNSADIKKLSVEEMKTLASEIRELLISTISQTGGHLASNLGVVEITLAIHNVFNFPEDKVVFDVGHQSYVHKIITGRKNEFDTLRQYHGISGFPKISESEYDAFDTGHSSTSISVAYAIAAANKLNNNKNYAIAVIGDGAISNGLALEALNNAGRAKTNLIVILNDNEMSIDKNVGNISNYLTKIRTRPGYGKVKSKVKSKLNNVPIIGEEMVHIIENTKIGIKRAVIPGTMFDDFGFNYIGPVDGHDIEMLKTVLARAKFMNMPVLIHTVTKKGKGYSFAEKHPELYHGVSSFDINKSLSSNINVHSFSYIAGMEAFKIAKSNKDVIAVCAAMSDSTGLAPFKKAFSNRFFDVGISEGHAVTFSAGLAQSGKVPMVFIYSTFMQRAYDNIVHDVALTNQHVVMCFDRAGLVGNDGETHHGIFDVPFLNHIPNLKILTPYCANGLKKALYTAVYELDCPVAIRYPRGTAPDGDEVDDIFKAQILRTGNKVTVVSMSQMTSVVKKAEFDGDHIHLNSIKPIDIETIITSVKKTGRLVTVEDNLISGGMGQTVSMLLNKREISVKTQHLGINDQFVTHGSVSELLKELKLDKKSLEEVLNK